MVLMPFLVVGLAGPGIGQGGGLLIKEAWAQNQLVQVAGANLSEYALMGTENLYLGEGTIVGSGDVGVNNGAVLGGAGELTVGKGTVTVLGVTVRGPKVTVRATASVKGNVEYRDRLTVEPTGFIGGQRIIRRAWPLVQLPQVPRCQSGGQAVGVGAGAVRRLAAGVYTDVVVQSQGRLVLTGGNYQFRRLDIKQGGRVEVEGRSSVCVDQDVRSESSVSIAPVAGRGLVPGDVTLVVEGENVLGGKAVVLGASNTLVGQAYVAGIFSTGASNQITGLVMARNLAIGLKNKINKGQGTGQPLVDLMAPTVRFTEPADGSTVLNLRPTIRGEWRDEGGSGIDTNSASITLDGRDVTREAVLTVEGFKFGPSVDLAEGLHRVRASIADRAGNRSVADLQFTAQRPEQPPILSAIGNREINLGSRLYIPLTANDPNGDDLEFYVRPLPLPEGARLYREDGVRDFFPEPENDRDNDLFEFYPTEGQEGEYVLTFGVTDGEFADEETVTIRVNPAPEGGATSMSGRLLDTNAFVNEGGAVVPVVGAVVRLLGQAPQAVSDAQGYFNLEGITGGKQVFDINPANAQLAPDGRSYAGFREEITLQEGVANVIGRPFYLPRIAPESMTDVDPNAETTVENPNLRVSMMIPPQTAVNEDGTFFDGAMSISLVEGGVAPAVMPEEFMPAMVVTLQPIGVRFNTPVPIRFPNINHQYAAGDEVDLWSLDAGIGRFVVVGRGRVSEDGQWIDTIPGGGIRANDWHFVSAPSVGVGGAQVDGDAQNLSDSCQRKTNSTTGICNGNMRENHDLASYRSQGQARSLSLVYNSVTADPRPIVATDITMPDRTQVPNYVSSMLRVGGAQVTEDIYTDMAGVNRGEVIRQALQFDASGLETGMYPYQMRIMSHYNADGIGAFLSGNVIVNNRINSPYGAGWNLVGVDRLKIDERKGEFTLIEGSGDIKVFKGGAGRALRFDGVNDAVLFAGGPLPGQRTISAVHTVEAWIKPESEQVGTIIMNSYDEPRLDDPGAILRAGSRQICYSWGRLRNFSTVCAEGNWQDQWIHVAATHDQRRLRLYVNGDLAAEVAGNGEQSWAWGFLTIGAFDRWQNWDSFYTGEIDEVRFFNQARTREQIRATMNRNVSLDEPGLTSYWRFDEEEGLGVLNEVNQQVDGRLVEIVQGLNDRALNQPEDVRVNSTVPLIGQCAQGEECPLASPQGDFSRMIRNGDGSYTRVLKNGTRINFNAQGLQTSVVDRNGNTSVFEYDGGVAGGPGLLTRITDPVGLVTQLLYDAGGRLSNVTDPDGRRTLFSYDAAGNLTSITDPDGQSRIFSYDERHRLIEQTDKRGSRSQYEYNFAGHNVRATRADGSVVSVDPIESAGLADTQAGVGIRGRGLGEPIVLAQPIRSETIFGRFTDARGNVTQYKTDIFGRATRVVDALGRETVIERDEHSQPVRITEADGTVMTMTYDDRGNVLTITDEAIGATTRLEYERVFNQVTRVVDANGNAGRVAYDQRGNPTTITDAQNNVMTLVYNEQGLLTEVRDALNNNSSFTYNAVGNLETITDPRASVTRLAYDGRGNIASFTDALNRVTSLEYDVMNRLTREVDAIGGATRYTYDPAGNLLSVEDAANNRTSYEYDALNRLVRTTDPRGQADTFTYDGNGNLTRATDRNGQILNFEYDVINQLIRKTLPGNLVVNFEYDQNGNLTRAADSDTALSFAYDGASRLTSTSTAGSANQPEVAVNYTYDRNGNRLTLASQPLGQIGYAYDVLNRVSRITAPTAGQFNFTYDQLSRRTQVTLPNAVTTSYAYDAASQLTSLTHQLNNNPLSVFGYEYDAVGNRTRMTQQRQNPALAGLITPQVDYVYDPLYRLIQATRPLAGQPNEIFTYDALGNRIRRDGQGQDARLEASNRLLEDATFVYTYDNNGNMTSRRNKSNGEVTRYTYDAENQLTRIDFPAGGFAEYRYDALGRRVEKNVRGTITRYIYDNEDILLEYNGANQLIARYTHGAGIDEPLLMERDVNGNGQFAVDERFYYHTDGLGSIVDLTNNASAVAQSYIYDSFGNILRREGNITNPYTYTGRELDEESGLYHYRFRYYDPTIGRFLQEDPIELKNLYPYTNSNPINFTDPYGEYPWWVVIPSITLIAIELYENVYLPIRGSIQELENQKKRKKREQEIRAKEEEEQMCLIRPAEEELENTEGDVFIEITSGPLFDEDGDFNQDRRPYYPGKEKRDRFRKGRLPNFYK